MGVRKNIRDDFDPSQWEVIYLEDTNHEGEGLGNSPWMWLPDEHKHLVNRLKDQLANDEVPFECFHCGQTRLRWIAFIWNEATDEVAMVGQVCADRADLPNQGAMFRRDRERALKTAGQSAAINAARAEWEADRPDLATFLDDYREAHGESGRSVGPCGNCGHDGLDHRIEYVCDRERGSDEVKWCQGAGVDGDMVVTDRHGDRWAGEGKSACGCRKAMVAPNGDDFVGDMVRVRRLYGALSDRQTEVLAAKPEQIAARIGRWEGFQAKNAERDEALKTVDPLTEGRHELTGVIQSVKEHDSDFGVTLKMVVELEDGNRVWGTVPSAVEVMADQAVPEGTEPADWESARKAILVGATITFTATVVPSHDDIHFGFTKRPSFTKKSVFIPNTAELEGAN